MKPLNLTIVRGLPTSDKSAYAAQLALKTGAKLFEPDEFLRCSKDSRGRYRTSYRDDEHRDFFQLALQSMALYGGDAIFCDVLPKISDVEEVCRCYDNSDRSTVIHVVDRPPSVSKGSTLPANPWAIFNLDSEALALEWEPWNRIFIESTKPLSLVLDEVPQRVTQITADEIVSMLEERWKAKLDTVIAARFRELIEGYFRTFMDISVTKKSQ